MPHVPDLVQHFNKKLMEPYCICVIISEHKEERYNVNELELLGIVWSIDYFGYYVHG